MRGELIYALSTIIASFRPSLFKHYKKYMLFTVIVSLLSMWLGSVAYEIWEKGTAGAHQSLQQSLQWENVKLSLLSESRFFSKAFSLLYLPISVAVPLSQLFFASAAFFDHYINNTQYDYKKILSIIVLILSGTVISWADYTSSKSTSLVNYLIGLSLMAISIILGGYMLIRFQNLDKKFGPGITLMTEATASLIVLLPLLFVTEWPSWKMALTLFLATTFLFNIDILLKFIGLREISSYQAIVLGTIGIIFGTMLGPYLFNESMSPTKLVALIVLIVTVISSASL